MKRVALTRGSNQLMNIGLLLVPLDMGSRDGGQQLLLQQQQQQQPHNQQIPQQADGGEDQEEEEEVIEIDVDTETEKDQEMEMGGRWPSKRRRRTSIERVIDLREERNSRIASAFLDEETSDVALIVGCHRFPVHRSLLAFQSEYFKSLFYGKYQEKDKKEMELKDVDPKGFRLLLRFLYKNVLHVKDLSTEQLMSLYTLSEQFLIRSLSQEILDFVEDTVKELMEAGNGGDTDCDLSLGAALDWFTLLKSHGESQLKGCLKMFLESRAPDLLKEPAFSFADFDAIQELLSSDAFFAPEVDIYLFIKAWIESRLIEGNHVDLKAAYSLVRFPFISSEHLSDVILSIKDVNLDLRQHLDRYRGSFHWKKRNCIFGWDIKVGSKFSGPRIRTSEYTFDTPSKTNSLTIEFDEPYAFHFLVLGSKVGTRGGHELEFKFYAKVADKAEQLAGEVKCTRIPFDGQYFLWVCLQKTVIASKMVITDYSPQLIGLDGLRIMETDAADDGCWRRIYGFGEQGMMMRAVNSNRTHFFVGVKSADPEGEDTEGEERSPYISHPIPSVDGLGITFFFLQQLLVNRLTICLLPAEGVEYDIDVAVLSAAGITQHQTFTRCLASRELNVTIDKQHISAVRLLGKKIYNSRESALKINQFSVDLIEH